MTERVSLPAPKDPRRAYRVGFICLGNICRSPIAEATLLHALRLSGLADRVTVDSGGTGDWHIGEQMDRRARAVLATRGYDGSSHRARLFDAEWYDDHDLFLVMDRNNLADVRRLAPDDETAMQRVLLLRSFDPQASEDDIDVPDPWEGGPEGFQDVLTMVERSVERLVVELGAFTR
jgi:low molecular weight protein-tyrosine phosphatase